MRSFQMCRAFSRFESWDMIAFGGEGGGLPGSPTSSALGRRRRLRYNRP